MYYYSKASQYYEAMVMPPTDSLLCHLYCSTNVFSSIEHKTTPPSSLQSNILYLPAYKPSYKTNTIHKKHLLKSLSPIYTTLREMCLQHGNFTCSKL